MAASLSRPDPSSPASVAEASFTTTRRGFNADEVRAFLVSVAAEMGRLHERERQLEAELREARESADTIELDDETVTKLLGEETLRVLQTARESASQIKVRAEENAARTLRDALDEANRVRQEIEVEVARKRQDATSDAEAEVALAKQQGREMVNEARAYRERVLADLDRRTTLARQQIEELVHGRDRLLQVFERARLVAVDVTSELRAIDAPDELVNLTPTTGPVPLMVPNQRRRDAGPDADVTAAVSVGDTAETIDVPDAETDDTTADDTTADDTTGARAAAVDATGADTDDEQATTPEVVGDDTADDTDDDTGRGTTDDTDDAAAGEVDTTADVETVDTVDVEADTAELADADETDADETDADETDADEADADEADAGDADEEEDGSAGRVDRDTNVVSLFRGRPSPAAAAAADEHPSTDEGADRPDVGGIFERLRREVPAAAADEPGDTEAGERAAAVADAGGDVTADDDVESAVESETDGEGDVAEATAFSRRDEAIVPLIVSGARRLKRVLADEQNEALDTLRQREPVTTLDALVPVLDDHVAHYLEAITDDLSAAAAAGAVEAGAKDTKTVRNKLAKAGALATAREQLRQSLVTPLRDRLGRAITDGDGDNDDITKRVRAVYREWKTQHIDDQLDDVFRRAFSGGLSTIIEPGTPLVWTIDPSASACPDCEDNSLADGVPSGEPFPTGHLTAPAHPGCRCLALPRS